VCSLLSAFALLLAAAAFAPVSADTPQQERMKTCNAQAGSQKLTGDARKTFMTDCLSGKTAATAQTPITQQEKMKSCNEQASGQKLMGDARRSFMSSCLRG
jgi:hypothetical protein